LPGGKTCGEAFFGSVRKPVLSKRDPKEIHGDESAWVSGGEQGPGGPSCSYIMFPESQREIGGKRIINALTKKFIKT
jgi:hypothetical protein